MALSREEAAAIVALRKNLVGGPNLDDVAYLYYLRRPTRGLPVNFEVISFFVYINYPEEHFECVDPLIKLLLPRTRYPWKQGGVREWDGLILDITYGNVEDVVIQDELSYTLFGALDVLSGANIRDADIDTHFVTSPYSTLVQWASHPCPSAPPYSNMREVSFLFAGSNITRPIARSIRNHPNFFALQWSPLHTSKGNYALLIPPSIDPAALVTHFAGSSLAKGQQLRAEML